MTSQLQIFNAIVNKPFKDYFKSKYINGYIIKMMKTDT